MPLRRWTRSSLILLAAIMWLGVGVVAPLLVTLHAVDVAGDAVEASSADYFSISQPVILSSAPLIRVERGTIAFIDSSGKVLPAQYGEAPPAATGTGIRLYNALVTVAAAGSAKLEMVSEASPFASALAGGRFEVLSIRNSTVQIGLSAATVEQVHDVRAELSMRRRGQVAIKGTGELRGHRIAFDATASAMPPADRKAASSSKMPLKFNLKGNLIDLSFDGRMSLENNEIGLEGPADLAISSGRAVARWLGANWPTGGGLRDIAIRGQMEYTRQTLSFERATVRMDGNEGSGVLSMRFVHPRPALSGTLAYKLMDIGPYLSLGGFTSLMDKISWSRLSAGLLTVPLGMHLDADLRLSADRVALGRVDLGPAATTIALKDGRLLADIAGLKLAGGEGGGQLTADFTSYVPRVMLRGKLESLDAGQMTGMLAGTQYMQGKFSLVGELAGSGTTLRGIVDGLTGKLTLKSLTPGRFGVDLRGLALASREHELVGWQAAAKGATSFDSLEARMILKEGSLLTENVEIRGSEGAWAATGIVNLNADRIDVRMTQSVPASGPARAAPVSVVEIKGHASDPRIKSERVR